MSCDLIKFQMCMWYLKLLKQYLPTVYDPGETAEHRFVQQYSSRTKRRRPFRTTAEQQQLIGHSLSPNERQQCTIINRREWNGVTKVKKRKKDLRNGEKRSLNILWKYTSAVQAWYFKSNQVYLNFQLRSICDHSTVHVDDRPYKYSNSCTGDQQYDQ